MQKINLRDLYPDVYKTDVFVMCIKPMSLRTPEVPAQGPLLSEPGGWH